MISKTQFINSLTKMPENLSVDQLIDKIIFMEKVQKGLDDSEAGRVNTKAQAKEKFKTFIQ